MFKGLDDGEGTEGGKANETERRYGRKRVWTGLIG